LVQRARSAHQRSDIRGTGGEAPDSMAKRAVTRLQSPTLYGAKRGATHMAEKSPGAIYPDLEGKSVLVTGGGSGIGAAIVRAFVRQKAKVGFIDIAEAPSSALVAELGGEASALRFVKADIRDIAALRAAIAALTQTIGAVDVLINNAANDERHATPDVTPEMFDERIAVNLRHSFFAAQAVLPGMQAKGGGAIVNFSSMSWIAGMGGMPIYTAAKSAMIGLTRSLARDFGPYNIRQYPRQRHRSRLGQDRAATEPMAHARRR
jgi:D-xylose 1-dehydrogenase